MHETPDHFKLEMRAHEAFIRRAAIVDFPFVLKGSYVTRQYFNDPSIRIPADVDWVAMHTIENEEEADKIFTQWVTEVTELEIDDDVTFVSFKNDPFWRRIDYAMSDDFPTVNTDIRCSVSGMETYFGLDISFNLDIDYPLVPLEYKPIKGAPFTIPNTVPLNLQVAWKIHQTLVRPRFKDLFDLIYLVQHPDFDQLTLTQSLQALLDECKADNVNLKWLNRFLHYKIRKLFPNDTMHETWDFWRLEINKSFYGGNINYSDRGHFVTDVQRLPEDVNDFLDHFESTMKKAGWTPELVAHLNIPEEAPIENVLDQSTNFWSRIKRVFRS